jgi:heptosyltransferase III
VGHERILLIRPGGIGDCILHFPRMESLRGGFTEVWVPRAVTGLVQFGDVVPDTGIDWVGLPGICPPAGLMEHLASFDAIHTWYGSSREEFRAALGHLPVEFHPAHEPGDGVPHIRLEGKRHGSVILHPFSSSAKKNWPLEEYRALARRLEGELGQKVAWTAGPDEELDRAVRFPDLVSWAKWAAGAKLYIGNDTGTTHLAAAVGVPVVALFVGTDPERWAPRGSHVRCCAGPTLTKVYRAVASLIDCLR